MKTLKNSSLLYAASMLVVCMFIVACGSDDVVEQSQPQSQSPQPQLPIVHFSTEVTADVSDASISRANGPLKIAINESADQKVLNTNWEVNDEIAIIYTNTNNEKDMSKVTVSSVGTSGIAYIEGTLQGPKNGSDVKMVYPYDAADMAQESGVKADYLKTGQDGTLETIADKYAVNVADSRLTVDGTTATLQSRAHFFNKVAICKFTFKENGTTLTGINYLSVGNMIIRGSNLSAVYVAFDPTTVSGEKRFTVLNGTAGYSGTASPSLTAGTFYRPTLSLTRLEHEVVDLGLPSGILWATMNIGATAPEKAGDWYAWGETETYYEELNDDYTVKTWKTSPKDYSINGYRWANYKWCNGTQETLTKYNNLASYGNNGFVDNKRTLDPEDDVAHVKWGDAWRIPSNTEWLEMVNLSYTSRVWTTISGMSGYTITSNADNTKSIFLPAPGVQKGTSLVSGPSTINPYGRYQSNITRAENEPHYAWHLCIYENNNVATRGSNDPERPVGRTVRAVVTQ